MLDLVRIYARHTDLTGGVDDVAVIVDTVVVDALREGVLDCWVIRLDEMVLDELYDER
jgi:hypothetical protein